MINNDQFYEALRSEGFHVDSSYIPTLVDIANQLNFSEEDVSDAFAFARKSIADCIKERYYDDLPTKDELNGDSNDSNFWMMDEDEEILIDEKLVKNIFWKKVDEDEREITLSFVEQYDVAIIEGVYKKEDEEESGPGM